MPSSFTHLQSQVHNHPALAILFGAPDCGVCRVFTPKLLAALETRFPRLVIERVDTASQPEAAAQFSVFSIPTLLVFFEGKETLRESRVMSVGEVTHRIQRPYDLLFAESPPPR